MRDSVDFEKLVQSEIPLDFLSGFVKGIPLVYKAAYEHIKANFDTDLGRDILPHFRRGKIDEFLCNAAKQFNLTSSIYFNNGNNCRHSRIKCGSIILTANFVSSPSEIVRRALFRDTLAQNNQFPLFPDLENRTGGDSYYAILLHGTRERVSETGFVWLVIPSSDSKSYLYRLNLVDYCNIELYPKAPEESIEDMADVRLRRNLISVQK